MFEYVNEVIINSAKDLLSGKDKFDNLLNGGFRVLRVGEYLASNVKDSKVYKTVASDPVLSISELTVPSSILPTQAGVISHIRLAVGIQLMGSADSYFAERLNDRRRRMFYANMDIVSTDNVNDIAAKLVEIIKRQDNLYDNLRFSAKVDGAKITITSDNEFEVFNIFEIQKLQEWNDAALGNYYPKEPVYQTLVVGTSTQMAKEGFGTYWTMLKNVQIQTSLRTGIFNQDNDDSKILIGAKYNQYVFDYEAIRDITGMGAVGEELKSRTKAIFWINDTISSQFETVVKNAGLEIDDIEKASDNANQTETVSMSLSTGETKYANIKLTEYDEVESNNTEKVTVKGTAITGVASGSANVVYKKNGTTVLTITVTVS